jgi:hypothetical protein
MRGKLFNEHKEFALNLSNTELWKLLFKKSWNNYSIKSHQKTSGSKKQIQKSQFSKLVKK